MPSQAPTAPPDAAPAPVPPERTAGSSSIAQTMGPRLWAALVALSLIWGGSFFFIGVAVRELPTLTVVTLRVSLAAAALWAAVLLTRRTLPHGWRAWRALFWMGTINNAIPFALIVWSQQFIASGLASILNATTPLFTVLVAGLLLSDERLHPRKLAGAVIGFTGVAAMIGFDALAGMSRDLWAQAAVLGAALSYAFAGVYGRRFRTLGLAPLVTAAGQVTAAAVILAPLTILIDRPWSLAAPGAGTWAAVLALALVSTAFAYVLYFRILAQAGATNLLLVTFLVPVSAILLGAMFLGERLGLQHLAGMALIGAGLVFIDGRLLRRRAGRAKQP